MADIESLRRQLTDLKSTLEAMVQADREDEVEGRGLRAADAVLRQVREHLGPNHYLVESNPELISPETIEEGQSIRAADLLLEVGMLLKALRPQGVRIHQIQRTWGR